MHSKEIQDLKLAQKDADRKLNFAEVSRIALEKNKLVHAEKEVLGTKQKLKQERWEKKQKTLTAHPTLPEFDQRINASQVTSGMKVILPDWTEPKEVLFTTKDFIFFSDMSPAMSLPEFNRKNFFTTK